MSKRPNDTGKRKGYEPGNCRWVDHRTQCRNRRSSKLTEASVARIRAQLAGGESYSTVAAAFAVSKGMVAHIAQGKKWQ